MLTRIDIIGQNGNDGDHYMPQAHFPPFEEMYPDPKKPDMVHQPSHYCDGGIETRQYMEAKYSAEWVYHYAILNAQKYLSRFHKKGSAVQDLKKCKEYIDWALDYLEGKR